MVLSDNGKVTIKGDLMDILSETSMIFDAFQKLDNTQRHNTYIALLDNLLWMMLDGEMPDTQFNPDYLIQNLKRVICNLETGL